MLFMVSPAAAIISLNGRQFVRLLVRKPPKDISFLQPDSPAAGPNGKYCPDIMQIFAPTNDETCRAQSARYVGDIKAQ